MDTNALLDVEMNSDESWRERVARKVQVAHDRALLEEIKATVRRLDPVPDRKRSEFRLPVLLTVAAFVGPDINRLVAFTRYSRTFVEAVSRRMRACGRWADDKVQTDHWFDGDYVTADLWLDCLVADGTLEVVRGEDGEEWFRDPE